MRVVHLMGQRSPEEAVPSLRVRQEKFGKMLHTYQKIFANSANRGWSLMHGTMQGEKEPWKNGYLDEAYSEKASKTPRFS